MTLLIAFLVCCVVIGLRGEVGRRELWSMSAMAVGVTLLYLFTNRFM